MRFASCAIVCLVVSGRLRRTAITETAIQEARNGSLTGTQAQAHTHANGGGGGIGVSVVLLFEIIDGG